MPDEINVQPDAVSTETESTTEAKAEVKQPSIDEITGKLTSQMDERINKLAESFRREMQSAKDKSIAEVERARRQAEEHFTNAMRTVVGDDPDLQTKAQLAQYQARERLSQQKTYEDMSHRQQEEFDKNFKDANSQFVTDLGINPEDKRIDWGDGEGNYLERMKRIQKSVAQITKEQKKALEDNYAVLDKRIKEIEGKAKKQENIEANSVDTSHAAGSGSDEAFMKSYAEGTIPINKENYKRYQQIMSK